VPRLILRRETHENEATLQTRLVRQVHKTLSPEEAAIVDAGFGLSDLLGIDDLRFVARVRTNQSARRNFLPVYGGKGARPKRGELVRPLPRTRKGKTIAPTAPDAIARWSDGQYDLEAHVWNDLVLPDQKPGARTFRVVAIYDPRYKEPLLLATALTVSAWAVWRLYRDRWAVEHARLFLGKRAAFVCRSWRFWRAIFSRMWRRRVLRWLRAFGIVRLARRAVVFDGYWLRCILRSCPFRQENFAKRRVSPLI
jgi:hypothetical protein